MLNVFKNSLLKSELRNLLIRNLMCRLTRNLNPLTFNDQEDHMVFCNQNLNFFLKRDHKKKFYELHVYESVDDKILSYAL